jgi:copper homeostasis protein
VETPYILEISVDTLERALAAERGGAHRIELCRELSQGGLTPEAEWVRSVRDLVRVPIIAMIRPRGGDFVYSDSEYAEMEREIEILRPMGVDGLVFGMLRTDGRVDVARARRLMELARPLPVTFHRAIDVAADIHAALEDVVQSGAVRVLSSGGAATAVEGIGCLNQLVKDAAGRIVVMPGSGILAGNIVHIAETTGAREFHAGLSSAISGGQADEQGFEEKVRQLRQALEGLKSSGAKRCKTDSGLGH